MCEHRTLRQPARKRPRAPGRASSGSRHFLPRWARATSQRTHSPRALGRSSHTRCFRTSSWSQGTQHSTGQREPPDTQTHPAQGGLAPQDHAGRHKDVRSQHEWHLMARVPRACGAEPPNPPEEHSRQAPEGGTVPPPSDWHTPRRRFLRCSAAKAASRAGYQTTPSAGAHDRCLREAPSHARAGHLHCPHPVTLSSTWGRFLSPGSATAGVGPTETHGSHSSGLPPLPCPAAGLPCRTC